MGWCTVCYFENYQKRPEPGQDLRAELEGLYRSWNADSGRI